MKQFCAPTEHDYQAQHEPISSGWWYSYSSRTLLYCRKCGHHFYVKKSPQQYTPSTTTGTWTYTIPFSGSHSIYSGTATSNSFST